MFATVFDLMRVRPILRVARTRHPDRRPWSCLAMSPGCGTSGFTLIELLVVVTILSAIAFMALDTFETDNNQVRFEDTRNRVKLLRSAILGPRQISANGEAIVGGFVADLGRLPACVQELLEIQVSCDGVEDVTMPAWGLDGPSGLYSGWRGPYIATVREQGSGLLAFRDGWGNADASANYGWGRFAIDGNNALVVQSLGQDGLANEVDTSANSIFERDYPSPAGADQSVDPDPLIVEAAYSAIVPLALDVALRNDTAGTVTIAANSFCLRLYYPNSDRTSADPIVSLETGLVPSAAVDIDPGDSETITVTFTTTPLMLPWGQRTAQLFEPDAGACGEVNRLGATSAFFQLTSIRYLTLLPQSAPITELFWTLDP